MCRHRALLIARSTANGLSDASENNPCPAIPGTI